MKPLSNVLSLIFICVYLLVILYLCSTVSVDIAQSQRKILTDMQTEQYNRTYVAD